MYMSTKGSVIKPKFVSLVIRSHLRQHKSLAEEITANRIIDSDSLQRYLMSVCHFEIFLLHLWLFYTDLCRSEGTAEAL